MWAELGEMARAVLATRVVALPGILVVDTVEARGAMRGAVGVREPAEAEVERRRFCVEARFWPWREEPVAAGAVETPLPETALPGPPRILEAVALLGGRVQAAEVATTVEEEEAGVAVIRAVGMGAAT